MIRLAALVVALLLATPAWAQVEVRDRNLIWKFRKLHPCPATGKVYGACRGWNVDHIVALRCGGKDAIDNMQWLSVREHKAKTRREMRECRGGKRK